jgi:hypothetical protein
MKLSITGFMWFHLSKYVFTHLEYKFHSGILAWITDRMLVHMIRPFSKLADAHKEISKAVGGWFITLVHGLFCA